MSAALFTPITIRNVTLKNRIVVSPMCEYSSVDGFANDWHLVHLGSRAVGGAGLVMTEATAVSPEGRITPDDLGIWKDDHITFLKRIADFIEKNNAVPAMQLAHAGRKASNTSPWKGARPLTAEEGAWQVVAASAIAFKDGDPVPQAMDLTAIKKCIADFKNAAARSIAAGFKVLEIHAAHGYLINSFLSPFSNNRTDEYGGSFENRTRFLVEIVEAIRTVMPKEYPLFVRISATEWKDGGWTIDDSVALAKMLMTKDVDLIDCSSGGNITGVKIPIVPMYQAPLAEQIKKETGILTAAVGMINTAEEGNSIITNNRADLVFMAREFLRDPYFPLHAAKELGEDVPWPNQYIRAKR